MKSIWKVYDLRFPTKKAAIAHALEVWKGRAVVENLRTKAYTYILMPDRTSCAWCGNELESRNHCPACGTDHYYATRSDIDPEYREKCKKVLAQLQAQ